ncbi:hypothetical protein LTR53_013942 [Teratosphaeriaceae sp. CCFEE 6253]|nr:hypothetical protein LTR53_013942 [Teratosphaeriaceae sp. CCFEE 6253]
MPEPSPAPPVGPLNLFRPLLLLAFSAYYIPLTIVSLLLSLNFSALLHFSEFQDIWFAKFWAWFGSGAREVAAPHVVPLLQHAARGVCLDIGPGSGEWLYLFARANNGSITKIYGVEPNKGMHATLRANAVKAGLGDVYEIIGCGAEELGTKGGVARGSVDTVITVQCLCSIPTPEKIIRELYPLLKPGGRWLVYEHVRTKFQGDFVAHWQRAINIIWPHFFGGCNITRPTDEWLLQAGEWDDVQLHPLKGEGKYDTVPHVIGTLTKRS